MSGLQEYAYGCEYYIGCKHLGYGIAVGLRDVRRWMQRQDFWADGHGVYRRGGPVYGDIDGGNGNDNDGGRHVIPLPTLDDIEKFVRDDNDEDSPFIPSEWTVRSIQKRFLLLSPPEFESYNGNKPKTVFRDFEVRGEKVWDAAGAIYMKPQFPNSQPCPVLLFGQMISVARELSGKPQDDLPFGPGSYYLTSNTANQIKMIRGPGMNTSMSDGGEDSKRGKEQKTIWWVLEQTLFDQIPRDIVLVVDKKKGMDEMEVVDTTGSQGDSDDSKSITEIHTNLSILQFYGNGNEKNLLKYPISDVPDTEARGTGQLRHPAKYYSVPEEDLYVEDDDVKNFQLWVAEEEKDKNCVVFLVGRDSTRRIVNRSVLARTNQVLCNMLYGTEHIPVEDFSKPICLPFIEDTVFTVVISALIFGTPRKNNNNKQRKILAPAGLEGAVCQFLDYIGVTDLSSLPLLEFGDMDKPKSEGWRFNWGDYGGNYDEWRLDESFGRSRGGGHVNYDDYPFSDEE